MRAHKKRAGLPALMLCLLAFSILLFFWFVAQELVQGNLQSIRDFDARPERDRIHVLFLVETRDLEATDTRCVHDIDDLELPLSHDFGEVTT